MDPLDLVRPVLAPERFQPPWRDSNGEANRLQRSLWIKFDWTPGVREGHLLAEYGIGHDRYVRSSKDPLERAETHGRVPGNKGRVVAYIRFTIDDSADSQDRRILVVENMQPGEDWPDRRIARERPYHGKLRRLIPWMLQHLIEAAYVMDVDEIRVLSVGGVRSVQGSEAMSGPVFEQARGWYDVWPVKFGMKDSDEKVTVWDVEGQDHDDDEADLVEVPRYRYLRLTAPRLDIVPGRPSRVVRSSAGPHTDADETAALIDELKQTMADMLSTLPPQRRNQYPADSIGKWVNDEENAKYSITISTIEYFLETVRLDARLDDNRFEEVSF